MIPDILFPSGGWAIFMAMAAPYCLDLVGYDAYLESPAWLEKRAAVLARAHGRCEGCGREGVPLAVHHRTYERIGQEDVDSDLRAVCRPCHEDAHGLREGRTVRAGELLPGTIAALFHRESRRNGGK